MSVGPTSRYRYSPIIRTVSSAGQVEPDHLDIRPRLVRTLYSDNEEYIPSDTDNWSRIAWKKLGNGRHYWVIADFSKVVDVFTELSPREKYKYLAQLAVDLPASSNVTSITLTSAKGVSKGQRIRIQDLSVGGASYESGILAFNPQTLVATIGALTTVAGIPAAFSRVSQITTERPRLVIPTVQRLLFDALDFGNPLNTLTE